MKINFNALFFRNGLHNKGKKYYMEFQFRFIHAENLLPLFTYCLYKEI